MKSTKDTARYQVFEKTKTGKSIIHNFRRKRDAQAKLEELKAAGTDDGPIWDCNNNELSRMFKF